MISYLEEFGGIEFFPVPGLPDYHPENPGGKTGGGRTLGVGLFAFDELGEWRDRVEVSPYYAVDLRMDETPLGQPSRGRRARPSASAGRCTTSAGMGGGLVGWLLAACLRAGVEFELSAPAVELVIEAGACEGL